jgi:hypothetical protein
LQQSEGFLLAVAQGITDRLHPQPARFSNVKESGQFASQQGRIPSPMLALPRQPTQHGIQFGFIQGHNTGGKRGQRAGWGTEHFVQPAAQLSKQGMQGVQTSLLQALRAWRCQ